MSSILQSLTDPLLSLLFPDRCTGCGRSGSLFCDSCRNTLHPYTAHGQFHPTSGTSSPAVLEQISIAFFFEGALRNAVHHLKYKRVRRIAKPLADLLAQHWQQHAYPVDALQPVPLHPQRLAERGFNQSELLAAHLASLSGVPLLRTGLVRSRDTAHQVGLDARQRSVNVQDAFFWQAASAAPMRVLLIDDVVTTGATLEACAQALRNAGSREVRALVLARSRLEP